MARRAKVKAEMRAEIDEQKTLIYQGIETSREMLVEMGMELTAESVIGTMRKTVRQQRAHANGLRGGAMNLREEDRVLHLATIEVLDELEEQAQI